MKLLKSSQNIGRAGRSSIKLLCFPHLMFLSDRELMSKEEILQFLRAIFFLREGPLLDGPSVVSET